jgi:peroxiredoxin 2/4
MSNCKVGNKAPLFNLPALFPNQIVQDVTLQYYIDRKQWSIIVFYPEDFTHICPTEITALSDRYEEFIELNSEIVAISVDDIDTHKKWVQTSRLHNGVENIRFPLASDLQGVISTQYGVFNEMEQKAHRGLFIVSPDGFIQYMTIFHQHIGRDVDETLRVLQALQTGGLCPASWKPGDTFIAIR